jgi:hypothetical protein
MDPEKNYSDVTVKIGDEAMEGASVVVSRDDALPDPPAYQTTLAKARADAANVLRSLPSDVVAKLEGIVKKHGTNRHARRASNAIVAKALRAKKREIIRDDARETKKGQRAVEMGHRLARRGWAPLPGMTLERAEKIAVLVGDREWRNDAILGESP